MKWMNFVIVIQKEIISTLNRRVIIPFYIPILALIVHVFLIKSKKIYLHKVSIFIYSFSLLVFTELVVRYTGINNYFLIIFISVPFFLFLIFYSLLIYNFSREAKILK